MCAPYCRAFFVEVSAVSRIVVPGPDVQTVSRRLCCIGWNRKAANHSGGVVGFVMGLVAAARVPGSRESPQPLDGAASVAHCPGMYGLNQICGICREIIR